MEKNTDIKQIFLLAGIALILVAILGGAILAFNTARSNKTGTGTGSSESSDMDSMHAPPAPADNNLFNSLKGAAAPDFSLESYGNGEMVSLSSLKGKKVVLFFSEGAMCYPGCWDQISAFVKDKENFAAKGAVVYTIVVDPKEDWKDAVDEEPKMASANVLLDAGAQVSTRYGVLTVDSSMHRGQYPGHTYLIVDEKGIIRYLLDDESMLVRNKELLAELAKI